MPLRTQTLPSRPSGTSTPSSSRILISTPGNGLPIPVPPAASAAPGDSPGSQAGTGDETEFRGAVVLEDRGVRCPAAGGLQGPRVELGAGADDAPQAGGVHAAGQPALAEEPEHGGHQDQPGDAVVADCGVGVADVELFEGVEFGAGIQALGEGVQVEAGGERSGREGPVVLAPSPKNSTEESKESCHERRERVNALGRAVVPEVSPIRKADPGGPSASSPPGPNLLTPRRPTQGRRRPPFP